MTFIIRFLPSRFMQPPPLPPLSLLTKLWTVLHRNGLRGKIAIALQSMYATVKARVRAGGWRGGGGEEGELTDVFLCPRGLKQGGMCSPVLFFVVY